MRASFAASILVVACAQVATVCPDDDPDCQAEAQEVFIRLPCDPELDPHCIICDPTYDPDCKKLVHDGPPCNPTDPDCHKTDSSGEDSSDSDSGSEGEGNPCPEDDPACDKKFSFGTCPKEDPHCNKEIAREEICPDEDPDCDK